MDYQSPISVHPGRILARALVSEGMTQKALAERAGLSRKRVSGIIGGEIAITPKVALSLENAFGGSAIFWLNLNAQYEESRARAEAEGSPRAYKKLEWKD